MIGPGAPTAPAAWMAVGGPAVSGLEGVLAAGEPLLRARDVFEALALLAAGARVGTVAVAAEALADRPRAALRSLRRHGGGARVVVLSARAAGRALRAARDLGVPVCRDAAEVAVPRAPALRRAAGATPEARRPAASDGAEAFARRALSRVDRPAALEALVLRTLARLAGAERASLLLREPGRETLRLARGVGVPEGLLGEARVRVGAGIAGRAASLGRAATGRGAAGGRRGYRGSAYVVLPFGAGRRCEGVACLTDLPGDDLPAPAALRTLVQVALAAGRALAAARRLARAEALSTTDGLTGLANRRAFERALRREVERARRTRTPLAVVLFDVDHFKEVNDRFGHEVGDRVLAEAARRLAGAVRGTDLVARWGGEEFAVLLPSSSGEGAAEEGMRAAERLREAVGGRPFSLGPGRAPRRVTVSGGLAVFEPADRGASSGPDAPEAPPGPEAPEGLIQRADGALYRAKSAGRDNVQRG